MAKPTIIEPQITEISVSYSVGVKANIGNYESSDVHLTKTEKWNVAGLTAEAADEFYRKRLGDMQAELDPMILDAYADMKGS